MTNVTKAELAREVWQQLVGYFFAHRESHLHAAHELGLTPGHMKTLFELDAEGGRSMGDLAVLLACDASNVTWLVDRLEERGLVERRPHPRDRRVKSVVLTPEGAKTKALLVERLLTPPEDLVGLERTDLDTLRSALTLLPDHPPFWEGEAEPVAE
ncbi:MAG TPA: MarR family transcriptional regulator [Acidimicrobiia bacterium]|nr:MarR family transcriptional regulator [Acidimicrobiia bacterium]